MKNIRDISQWSLVTFRGAHSPVATLAFDGKTIDVPRQSSREVAAYVGWLWKRLVSIEAGEVDHLEDLIAEMEDANENDSSADSIKLAAAFTHLRDAERSMDALEDLREQFIEAFGARQLTAFLGLSS